MFPGDSDNSQRLNAMAVELKPQPSVDNEVFAAVREEFLSMEQEHARIRAEALAHSAPLHKNSGQLRT